MAVQHTAHVSIHPLAAVWRATQTWNLVFFIFKVKLVIVGELKPKGLHVRTEHRFMVWRERKNSYLYT